MSITVATTKLIEILTDSLATACNSVGGVHVTTSRTPWGEEPGDVDVIVATSTTKYVVGHTWIPADGRLTPSVWPIESVSNVLAICKSLAKARGKEHTVDIHMTTAERTEDNRDDDHPGWTITLRETPALFDSDTEFQFHAHPEAKFPIRGVLHMMRGQIPPSDDEPVALTPWSPGVLGPLVTVAKRRNMQIRMFRTESRGMHIVQIGDTWIGAAMPSKPLPGEPTNRPGVEPVLTHEHDLESTLREMRDAGIRVTVNDPQGEIGKAVGEVAGQMELDWDAQLRKAIELVVESQMGSASMLQYKLDVGFARAQRLLDEMEALGIVGEAQGSMARPVYFEADDLAGALAALDSAVTE
ncbi:FtsK-like protein [Mycobacterium phage Brusacoram]|uniref:FtsK-like DNA translocase n=12 Tax=Caudoviricetes TaxID=2731619 RepID=A0A0K1Y663_9CAUD|nr:FtsK-like protein [Mycobacterium phage Malithi]YP_009193946.1 FtsK-like protein [Mycobacterium phage Brusacoram]YP_009964223.1 FtsK-like DNA translocase [Mycobacterium phage Willsammy]YP_009964304.1 FtsK-like DNA translocase [Mycobacterium phage Megiddo]YP_009964382.1 FtsK-like DNA translocase [Mycobacterium phage Atcoo]YP_009964538.1 FtsK-like DNA translocase [Mycobacterium phage GreaseLightnin]YP_009964617.1 FtsK-like DNA translocase [Mycobacterium phage Ksquared]YP_010001350.1 FtsK-lik